jgi:hypothetical protein
MPFHLSDNLVLFFCLAAWNRWTCDVCEPAQLASAVPDPLSFPIAGAALAPLCLGRGPVAGALVRSGVWVIPTIPVMRCVFRCSRVGDRANSKTFRWHAFLMARNVSVSSTRTPPVARPPRRGFALGAGRHSQVHVSPLALNRHIPVL